jgi:hypothetical protein
MGHYGNYNKPETNKEKRIKRNLRFVHFAVNCPMLHSIPTPHPVLLSTEQQGAYDAFLCGQSVAADSCAGSGKTHTARAVTINYKGGVEHVPFSRTLSDDGIAYYAGYTHVSVLNFHRRGLKLCGNVDKDQKKVLRLAETVNGKQAITIAELVEKMKLEAIGLNFEGGLTPEQVAVKYGYKLEFVDQALEVLALSDNNPKVVDFADMLRMPIITGKFRKLEGAIVLDEVQDYTPLAWCFLRDCLTDSNSHVFMIGDPTRQTLMAFAGASPEVFGIMANHFGCASHELTYNRRCAKAIVEAAPFRGNMQALPDAPQGYVGSDTLENITNAIADGLYFNDALLSETNAPLIKLGIQCLTRNIPVRMRVEKLDKMILRFAYPYLDTRKTPVGNIAAKVQADMAEAIANDANPNYIADMQDAHQCIDALETYCLSKGIVKPAWRFRKPISPIQIALGELCKGETGITLMTGHTAKGLEWNTVFHLPAKVKAPEQDWQAAQNNCVSHVIATRAIEKFITLSV